MLRFAHMGILLPLIISCSQPEIVEWSDEQWESLLMDMHVLGLGMTEDYDHHDSLYVAYWDILEEKYKYTQPEIRKAYNKLLEDDKRITTIYDHLLESLSEEERNHYRIIENPTE